MRYYKKSNIEAALFFMLIPFFLFKRKKHFIKDRMQMNYVKNFENTSKEQRGNMNKQITWNDIVNSFKNNPRNVSTAPVSNVECKWFYVYVENEDICIESGRNVKNSSVIKGVRKLNPLKLEKILDIYSRRKNGEKISEEARTVTVNQVYWYGIFKELKI